VQLVYLHIELFEPRSTRGRSDSELFVPCFCWWRWRASVSRLSSCVLKTAHVFLLNFRNSAPISRVVPSRILSVLSVCRRSFAKPCQWLQMNNNRKTILLCGSGRRPSKTGIEHWVSLSACCDYSCSHVETLTCSISSKSRAANFFISEVLFEKRRIVSWPKVGICLKLQVWSCFRSAASASSKDMFLTGNLAHEPDPYLEHWEFEAGGWTNPSKHQARTHASDQPKASWNDRSQIDQVSP